MQHFPLLAQPDPLDLEQLTVGDYLERWLSHTRSRVRATTADGYQALIRCHAQPHLGTVPLTELHPLHLQHAYSQLLNPPPPARPLAGGTVRNLHLCLHRALGQAVRWQLLTDNPSAGAQPPRPQRTARPTGDPAALHHLIELLQDHPLELPVAIAIATGMRRGEIVALRWQDLTRDYSNAHIQQTIQATTRGLITQPPKTHRSQRAIALPAFLTPYLARQRHTQQARRETLGEDWNDHDLIIDRGDGNPINPDTLSSSWRRFINQHNLPKLRFHDLRHSHATLMLLQGVHPKIVSERLGHASIGITLDTYSHVLPSLQHEAAQAFDTLFPTSSIRGPRETTATPS